MRSSVPMRLALFVSVAAINSTSAQPLMAPRHVQPYYLHSGVHDGDHDGLRRVYHTTIDAGDAAWVQVHFATHQLGEGSIAVFRSNADGGEQRLSQKSLKTWNYSTGLFRGGSVNFELLVDPDDSGVFVEIKQLTVGDAIRTQNPQAELTICDSSDDRIGELDGRVGRLYGGGCTAWLVSNGAVLTAGHCVDFDPDGSGPLLPDGILDLTGVLEVDVPQSQSNGVPVPSAIEDQYPIDVGSVVWNYDGSGQGLGKDYAIFRVGANTIGGLAHETEGFFRMTDIMPGDSTFCARITGCGVDDNEDNFSLQTDMGTFEDEVISGQDVWIQHRVDTMGANSGSPISVDCSTSTQGLAIGIHTNAGCTSSGGVNSGTSFGHAPLENAIQDFPGENTVYVDAGHPYAPTRDGTIFRPFSSLSAALPTTPDGGILCMVSGTYPSGGNAVTIGTGGLSVTIVAPSGGVVIGN